MVFANPQELLEGCACILMQCPSPVLVAEDVRSQFCRCLASSLYSLAWDWKCFLLRKGCQWCSWLNFFASLLHVLFPGTYCMSESVWSWCERVEISLSSSPWLSQWVQAEPCTVGLQDRAGLNPLALEVKGNARSSYFRGRYFHKAHLDFRVSIGLSKSIFKDLSALWKSSVIKHKLRTRIPDSIDASPEVCGWAAPSLGAVSEGLCCLFCWSQKNDILGERQFCPWMAILQEKLCSINARRPQQLWKGRPHLEVV